MSLRICSLSSGSSGNCIFVAGEKSSFLVDAGIPLSRVKKCLDVFGADLSKTDILITHTHSDHVKYLSQLTKHCRRVYCSPKSLEEIQKQGIFNAKAFEGEIALDDVLVSEVTVSHDVPCRAYSFFNKNAKASIATDLGVVSDEVCDFLMGSDLVMLESNHDPKLLMENKNYPPYLKKRILSNKGHLSNDACAEVSLSLALSGTKQILLAHLSKENNNPALAFNTVVANLESNGIIEGEDVSVEVALQDKLSGIYEIV